MDFTDIPAVAAAQDKLIVDLTAVVQAFLADNPQVRLTNLSSNVYDGVRFQSTMEFDVSGSTFARSTR